MVTAVVRSLLLLTTDADALVLINAMAVRPNNARQRLISQTIRAYKAAGLWSKLDALYKTAAHDSQAALLNWKAPGTWTLVPTNSPAFTVDRGYMGDGATSYLMANGYNPSTAGGNFALNSAVLGAWIQQATTVASSVDLAISSTSRIGVNAALTAYSARVNDVTSLVASPVSLATGHWAGRRLSSAGKDLWRGGAQYNATDAVASSALGTAFMMCSNTAAAGFSNGRVAEGYTCGGLADSEMVAKFTVSLSYMQNVGVA